MSGMALSLMVASSILVVLLSTGVQVGIVLALAAMAGSFVMTGNWSSALALPLIQSLDVTSSYTLMVIPLFIAMGSIAEKTGVTGDLFVAFYRWFGHRRGGIGVATIATCAGMSAITGSSMAVSASMAKIALPELRRYNYDDKLSLGAISMGGTLAIMIPPSITLVLYAIFAEQSVGQMLIAGVLPGFLIATLYMVKIAVRCGLDPALGPAGPRFSWAERMVAAGLVLPFLSIVLLVVLGILLGFWTPSEAAAVGLVLVMIVGAMRGRLTFAVMLQAAQEAVSVSAAIMLVVIGSMIFSNFVALNGISDILSRFVISLGLQPFMLYLLMVVIYVVLGMFLEATSILALTVPLFLPIAVAAGWHPVWFGVVLVCLMELAAVTPPVGLNLFVMKATVPDVTMAQIYQGSAPFWLVNIAVLFILYVFPQIALVLPSAMPK
jgi:C4-dicarboxylate transporter, DctM subunit